MPLKPAGQLVRSAAAEGTGIGAFNVLHLETAEALAAAAGRAGLPVILQISQNCVDYHGNLEPIAKACLALGEASEVPVAVHLDHAEREDLARHAIDLGIASVMFDGSRLPYRENVDATSRVVRYAHAAGAAVEAELGEVGGKNGAHAPGARTDPAEATRFVGETGVDSLAVAVGSSHAMTERRATLDLGLIEALHRSVQVPLVLHGSSGVPDDGIVSAIRAGLTKINVSTHLNGFFTRSLRSYLDAHPDTVDSRRYIRAGRDTLASEAERLIRLFRSASRDSQTE
ncbi:class II fructose-bisphosphate aldolase [Sinomonas sp. JGH33]|uniref:Class II fructose-bisphosphate aldolase n=1 Tax=Sinomonas terricola TaxID=3110330 RepID=A0ABU5TB92_9MICC|nr:class II fructose-bisphosphate aldolase [Sinomonas sp. JGH33]MEA5456910.1 class II fructose-bisphosphate aldolase [Sinomonas sp. JGH33]